MELNRNGEIHQNPNNLQEVDGELPTTRRELELKIDCFQIQNNRFDHNASTNFGRDVIVTTVHLLEAINVCSKHDGVLIDKFYLRRFGNIGYRVF